MFNGWFSTRWYGMLYHHRDEEDAAALALPLINKGNLVPGMEILDLACGRGRHAAIFAREGLRVTGIDLSEESIRNAALAVREAHFEVFDIRKPYATDRFDAAVCLFTSLGYTEDRKDDDLAVAAAAQALKPGGLFVLDLYNGERAAQCLVPVEQFFVERVSFTVKKTLEKDSIVKQITVDHPAGRDEFEERVHVWTVDEVKAMVARTGLDLRDITDGSCVASFEPLVSDRIVVWARKPA